MKQHFPILICLLLLPLLSTAQTNFKEGLVVNTAGDTLRGFIDFREWDFTPKEVSFKTSEGNGVIQNFNAITANYIEITGMEAYRTYNGPISTDKVDVANLSHGNPGNSSTTQQVLLKKLQVGPKVSLYSYKDNIKERFFIVKQGEDVPQELLYRRYRDLRNSTKIIAQHGYVGQLIDVARHHDMLSDKLKGEIESAAYTAWDLLKVVSKINGLSEEKTLQISQEKLGARLFAGVALSRSTMEVSGQDDLVDTYSNPASYMPRVAVGFDAFLNRNVQRTVLRLEANFISANYHIQATKNAGGGGHTDFSYRVAQQTVSVTPQIIYNLYNKDDLKLYVGGGVAINYSNYSKNTLRSQHLNPTFGIEGTPKEDENYKKLVTFWSSYAVRTGVVVNRRYEAYAMYLAPGSVTRYKLSDLTVTSFNVGINYLFKD